MTIPSICRDVAALRRRYGENDPFRLAADMRIHLMEEPLGDCKGFFLVLKRQKVITVNSGLSAPMRRIVCAHELGHAVLHSRSAALSPFHDFNLFSDTDASEYEANLFAADLLLEDSDVMEVLNGDEFFFGAAARLMVPAELLDFKFRILKSRGMKLDGPLYSSADFLKNVRESDCDYAD